MKRESILQFIAIGSLFAFALIVFGILAGAITTQVCPDYFSIEHSEKLESGEFSSQYWNTIFVQAVMLGIGSGVAARAGKRPMLKTENVLRPAGNFFLLLAAFAILMGAMRYSLVKVDFLLPPPKLYARIPEDQRVAFCVCSWVLVPFGGSGSGSAAVWIFLWGRRKKSSGDRGSASAR